VNYRKVTLFVAREESVVCGEYWRIYDTLENLRYAILPQLFLLIVTENDGSRTGNAL
jgi:hypothetical protein